MHSVFTSVDCFPWQVPFFDNAGILGQLFNRIFLRFRQCPLNFNDHKRSFTLTLFSNFQRQGSILRACANPGTMQVHLPDFQPFAMKGWDLSQGHLPEFQPFARKSGTLHGQDTWS